MRKSHRIRKAVLAAGVVGFGLASPAIGDTLVVDSTGATPGSFTSLQAAFDTMANTTLGQDRTIQVLNNGSVYNRASLAAVSNFSTGNFNLEIVGVSGTVAGKPTINDVRASDGLAGISSINLDNKPGTSVYNMNFVATVGGSASYIDNLGGINSGTGQRSVVQGNTFNTPLDNGARNAVSLRDNEYNRSSVIERNSFSAVGGALVESQTTSRGGRPSLPMAIRNNIVQGGSLLNVPNGQQAWGPDTDAADGSSYILNNSVRGGGTFISIPSASGNYDGLGLVVLNNALEGTSGSATYYALMDQRVNGSGPVAQNGTLDYNLFSTQANSGTMLARLFRVVNNIGQTGATFNDDAGGLSDWETFLATSGLGRDELNSLLANPGWDANLDLLGTSAAINAGAPLSTPLPNGLTLGQMIGELDFFGRSRVQGGAIDIGAAEAVPEPGSLTAVCLAGLGLLARRRRQVA